MPSLDQLQAFAAAADEGSFSAAARRLRKAQSAVSTAVINLEIDVGVDLFDRSGRNPQLTAAGTALLGFAKSVLQSNREFIARATSISEGVETQLCIAVEQGMFVHSLKDIFCERAWDRGLRWGVAARRRARGTHGRCLPDAEASRRATFLPRGWLRPMR